MESHEIDALLEKLEISRSQLGDLLASTGEAQDWSPEPGEWSFRFLAAHLATTEQECFQDRIQRIAAGDHPFLEYYLNTGRDFSRLDLRKSLQTWRDTRQAIFAFVRELSEDAWLLTGVHAINGPIKLWDVLVSMLEHDQEHLGELQQAMSRFRSEERRDHK